MQRLTGADATFLYAQTRTSHFEIASVLVLDPSTAAGSVDLATTRQYLSDRLHLVPFLRRRLVRIPLGLDHPRWIEDPDFDLAYHLREAALAGPGTDAQLAEFVADLMSRPLDQTRPLWECHLVSGLAGGRMASIIKVHHAAVDGVAGFDSLASLVDLAPDSPPPAPPAVAWRADREPAELDLLVGAVSHLALQPFRAVATTRRLLTKAVASRRSSHGGAAVLSTPGAPSTPFNTAVTPHRRVQFVDIPMADLAAVKEHVGTTLNDVVLAVVGGALRRYLQRTGRAPQAQLQSFVPLSTRTGAGSANDANLTTALYVGLHTDVADPVDRLRAIAHSSAEAKARYAEFGPATLTDITELGGAPGGVVMAKAMDLLRLNERVRLGANVVVSNIPGPPIPLFINGAKVERMYPVGPVADGNALNVTLISYEGSMGFGLCADRTAVPDLADLADDLRASADELIALTRTTPVPAPAPVTTRPAAKRDARRSAPATHRAAGRRPERTARPPAASPTTNTSLAETPASDGR